MRPPTPSVRLRRARLSDLSQIRRISRRVRRRDYVPAMFPRWVRDPRSYVMVAEQDGRVVAVSCARIVAPGEAWGQGLRVDPAVQRQGVGLAITRDWPDVLYRRGARVARVAVLAGNRASLRMMMKTGFRIVARMVRLGWWGNTTRSVSAAADRRLGSRPRPRLTLVEVRRERRLAPLWRRLRKKAARSQGGGLVLTGDHYAALTRSRAAGSVRRGDAYAAGRAVCLLDRRGIGLVPRPGWWIVALAGPPRDAAALARELLRRAVRRGVREFWIDAGRNARLVRALEAAGFTPPPTWREVTIVEARLPLGRRRAGAHRGHRVH